MIGQPASEPFDLRSTPGGNRATGIFFLLLAGGAGFAAYWHYTGHFALPSDLSTLPFELMCGLFGGMLTVMGLKTVLRYRGFRINPGQQTVREIRKGLFGSRLGEEFLFGDVEHVRVERTRGGRQDRSSTFYPVYVQLKSGETKPLFSAGRYLDSRARGEKLAKLFRVDYHDASQGEVQIRTPEQLDETVQARLSLNQFDREAPPRPDKMHSIMRNEMDKLVIEIPAVSLASLGPLKMVLWIGLALLGIAVVATLVWTPSMFTLVGAFILVVVLVAVLRSETVTLSRDTLAVRSGVLIFKRTQTIPLSELEELCLVDATGSEGREANQLLAGGEISQEIHQLLGTFVALGASVIARSDRVSMTFGRILSREELAFLLFELESRMVD